jgi:hypothetical protein
MNENIAGNADSFIALREKSACSEFLTPHTAEDIEGLEALGRRHGLYAYG